jgi:cytochrome b subunit of formate dehydrogenase
MTHTTAFVAGYDTSVHGLAAAAGNAEAAICSDCHGGHRAVKASSPDSKINHFNIAETCGACHGEIEATFAGSIHGVALADGNADSPTCTTCHSEHAIAEHTASDAPVAPLNVSEQVCRPCHESYKLSAKYGFASDRPASFGDSYHGLATRFGSDESANCASCHGVHDILPSTDERSKVHPTNIQATCGTCHPGATARFAVGSVHVIRTPEGDSLLYWITTIYILLIAVTIGSMAVHNALDWFRKMINHYHERLLRPVRGLPAAEGKRGLYVRMTVNERIQHALLAGSFILLTITGFMLKFPDAWWVVFLRDLFGVGAFELRGIIHRVAAVVMVGDSIYHIYYVAFTERGRQFLSDILFRGRDFKDVVHMLRYYLGATKSRPQFDRFNYVEKSEYWALIWGTIVMTVTGIVLWFENQFMGQFSKLFVDVSETIHYYEAWLAFLAIVVWHFYYVIFNPDVYPMNFTWLTGRITEEEMEHEHPLELKRIKAEAEPSAPARSSESNESPPAPIV